MSISRHYGNFLTYTYPAVKALFIVNIVAQMFLLSLWLGKQLPTQSSWAQNNFIKGFCAIGEGYRWYGFDILFSMIMEGKRMSDVTNLFPRVTWCEVLEREKESIHPHQMHCVLPINLFNEMVFLVNLPPVKSDMRNGKKPQILTFAGCLVLARGSFRHHQHQSDTVVSQL